MPVVHNSQITLKTNQKMYDFLTSTDFSLEIILWCIYAGVVLASIYTFIMRKTLGGFVFFLLEKKAFSEQSAVKLCDTPFAGKKSVLFALKHRGQYKKILRAFPEAKSAKKTPDVAEQSFYITDTEKAESICYEADTKNLYYILALIGVGIVIYILVKLIPTGEELIRVISEYAEALTER